MQWYPLKLIGLALVLFILSCENEDSIDPVISYIMPGENTIVNIPDTIVVEAEISDNEVLESVMLTLVDDAGTPVVPAEYFYPGEQAFYLKAILLLDDRRLAGGSYRLLITASDGRNAKNKYRELIINEIPLELTGYMAVKASLTFETTISRLNPGLETDTSFILPKGFLLSNVSCYWEQFYFASPEPSVIYSYSLNEFEPLWEFAAEIPRPVFTGIIFDEQLLFATGNSDAGILNEAGSVVLRTSPLAGNAIRNFAADEDYLYAEMVSLSGDVRQLYVFYRASGEVRAGKLISGDITGLVPIQGKLLMISNSGTAAHISEFDPDDNLITGLEILRNTSVMSSLQVSDARLLFFTEGNVLVYDYLLNQVSLYLGKSYDFGRYDHLNGRLFMVSNDKIDIYDESSADFIQSVSFDKQVLDFHILYNK